MTLLTIHNLSVAFPTPSGPVEAVKQASLTVEKGEMLALVGESGSGKSLTALACMGLLPASARVSGSITLNGQEMIGASEAVLRKLRGNRISMIFQEPLSALNPLHRIGRQVEEMLLIHTKLPAPARRARVHELLDLVGLTRFHDRLDAFPHQLSGGERQRLMIAMSIANNPDLLIADEPTTAVDVTIQAVILKTLKELQSRTRMSMLFITHDLTLVHRLADRVAVMRQGAIVEAGRVAEVFASPRHDYTRHLLQSEPAGMAPPCPVDGETVVACEDIKVHYPLKRDFFGRAKTHVKAVDGASLTLRKAETLGIVGESGSGKTTLALALLRLTPSRGRIVFMGRAIDEISLRAVLPLRRHMQLVFQDPFGSLNPRMSVEQIIGEGLRVHEPQLTPQERTARITHALQEVGLDETALHRYPHEFSGGQRQRISIARAIVLKPSLVALDEPTSALDLSVQAQIIALLRELQARHGLSFLFISHDLRVVRALAHRILVMRAGCVVEEADTQTLFASPREEYTQKLIQAAFLKESVHG